MTAVEWIWSEADCGETATTAGKFGDPTPECPRGHGPMEMASKKRSAEVREGMARDTDKARDLLKSLNSRKRK
jgi:hypothetical protein